MIQASSFLTFTALALFCTFILLVIA